jgi:hypothetical protein
MRYPTCWDTERVREVLTTESRQKARELFLQTHRPFRHIRVDFCKDDNSSGAFIGEEQVRAIVESGTLDADNRLFFVVGEAGSGKSELCQWLEYTSDRTRRLPIHIPRSMTSAAHVAALLRSAIGAEMSGLQHTPTDLQAEYIALSATVLLYEQSAFVRSGIGLWEQLLASAALRSEIAAHLDAARLGNWNHALLPSPEYLADLCAAVGVHLPGESLDESWRTIRRLLGQALEQTLWLGDLRALLSAISERAVAQGLRPLLLIEDVTAFRILGDRLLDYLLDLTSGHFDAVIGVTTGFERTQLSGATLAGDLTHIHHRLRARFALTDEQGRSYGLEEDVVELARSYLRAVKSTCDSCGYASNCSEIFGPDLYPFTETSLQRAFRSLQEEGNPRQTPRLFLEHVLGATLLSSSLPPDTLDRSAFLVQPPTLFRSDEVPDGRLQGLLRWYGQVHDDAITLDRRILDFWDIPAPDGLIQGDLVRATRAYVVSPPTAPPMDQGWHQELRELQRWLSSGGLYPNRETLKRGIERVLLQLGDPRSLASPHALSLARAEIYYARGDERLPIFLGRGSGDQPITRTALKVRVGGTPAERSILEELAYLALSGADMAQVCSNLALTLEWAQRHWEDYNAEVRGLLARELGDISAEQLVLITWKMIGCLLGAPSSDWLDLRPRTDIDVAGTSASPWSIEHHAPSHLAGSALVGWHETVRRLFIGMFTLRDTLIDRQLRQAALSSFDPDVLLERLARLPLQSLRALPFKIRPTGQKLYDLLALLHRYAYALRQFDVDSALREDLADLRQRHDHLVAQERLDLNHLRAQLAALRWRCGELGVVWREAWEEAFETLHALTDETIAALRTQTSNLIAATSDLQAVHPADVWRYQDLRHALRPLVQHPYWGAMVALRTVQDEVLQAAQERYRPGSKTLAGTQEYKALLQSVRQVRQELRDGQSAAH